MASAVLMHDLQGLPNFDVSNVTGIASKWKRWRRAFELYATGKGIEDAAQAKALLLHTAGMDVQDIFFTLPEGTGENVYAKALNALDKYFEPQANVPYERSVFRNMAQFSHETVEQYITRLRQRAETCEFGNRDAIDERIRDQIIDKCVRHNLRRKLLEKGRDLTLNHVREIARAMEDSERQATSIESQVPTQGSSVNKCKTKDKDHVKRRHEKIRHIVEQPDQSEEEKAYAFSVNQNSILNDGIVVNVGDVDLNMIIDSGAICNIMGMPLWNSLKENHINCVSSKVDKQLFAYGSQEPLKVAGIFTATVKYKQTVIPDVEFVVLDGKGQALLFRDTALRLGVLQIVSSVSEAVNTDNRTVFDKYPDCFEGVGKLKSFQLEIPIDPDVDPVIQPMRRIPYSLRDKLSKKLDELLDLDIIERVEEPNSWVSPVVCVPKHSGEDIRLCVDMRQANTAVRRVRHLIPTIDELLHEMNSSPADAKVKAVVEAREPRTSAEVRSFLGLVNYSSRFIPDLATIAAPLRQLTLIADASPVGLGAVLVQEQDGEFRVISYASRSLSDTERRYSQTEKEALALVWACERFHVYLYGVEFELLTDHKPLECIYSTKSKVCARIERWVLRMQPYIFKVRYIPGPKNIADTLSRLVKNDFVQKSDDLVDDYVRFVAKEATPIAMTNREIERASENDPELCAVRQCLVNQQWHRVQTVFANKG
ncbi:uncharacterized protein LOC144617972 [Crassostrea virginica]